MPLKTQVSLSSVNEVSHRGWCEPAREHRYGAVGYPAPGYFMLNSAPARTGCSETSRLMKSAPYPKRELLKLCARIGYTPH